MAFKLMSHKGVKFIFWTTFLLLAISMVWHLCVHGSALFVQPRTVYKTVDKEIGRPKVTDNDNKTVRLSVTEILNGIKDIIEDNNKPSRHKICVNFIGGLGNMLFQYATSYGIAKKMGFDIYVTSDSDLYQYFDIKASVTANKKFCENAKSVSESHSSGFDESLLYLRNDADYVFKEYLQSWMYFKAVEQDLRSQLRFRGDIEQKAYLALTCALKEKYGQDKYSGRTFVGIHIRRGNYLEKKFADFGYHVADKPYIHKAQEFFTKKFPNVTFVVCSNDMKWSKENVISDNAVFITDKSREIDLAVLASLNHTIMTVGTFSWWAAWLVNGTTLYYKDFIKNGSDLEKEFTRDRSDYLYPGWIGL